MPDTAGVRGAGLIRSDMDALDAIRSSAKLLRQARHAVALTGAGLSTESGIPDFRSPGGVWERFRPVEYQEFLANHEGRREHWRYKQATVPAMLAAQPNPAHRALADLEAAQRLQAVMTQNIDGLHQRAGSRLVLELHGTNLEALCLRCECRVPIQQALAQLEAGSDVPTCAQCGGWLKPATVSFGQSLPHEVLREATRLAEQSDCLLALGSSLVVTPAASLAGIAQQSGAKLIIITLGETPYDDLADVRIHAKVGEVLPQIASSALA
ncbi:MAG TPA: NAD-dependent deacylase [Candidatus Binatia bacterium]